MQQKDSANAYFLFPWERLCILTALIGNKKPLYRGISVHYFSLSQGMCRARNPFVGQMHPKGEENKTLSLFTKIVREETNIHHRKALNPLTVALEVL